MLCCRLKIHEFCIFIHLHLNVKYWLNLFDLKLILYWIFCDDLFTAAGKHGILYLNDKRSRVCVRRSSEHQLSSVFRFHGTFTCAAGVFVELEIRTSEMILTTEVLAGVTNLSEFRLIYFCLNMLDCMFHVLLDFIISFIFSLRFAPFQSVFLCVAW